MFMPADTPAISNTVYLAGAKTLGAGLITDCARLCVKARSGWAGSMFRLERAYRSRKKHGAGASRAVELAAAGCHFYPTGGGTGFGVWKPSKTWPTQVAQWRSSATLVAESDGCAPIVRAFDRGERFAELFPDAKTIASGIRVPAAVGDFMILDAVRASGGRAIAVSELRIREWMGLGMQSEGLAICPETAACIGALERLRAEQWIKPHEEVIVFNTGAAQKYPEAMQVNCRNRKHCTDHWDRVAGRH